MDRVRSLTGLTAIAETVGGHSEVFQKSATAVAIIPTKSRSWYGGRGEIVRIRDVIRQRFRIKSSSTRCGSQAPLHRLSYRTDTSVCERDGATATHLHDSISLSDILRIVREVPSTVTDVFATTGRTITIRYRILPKS